MNVDQARFNMIEQQIRPWDVLDPRVLELLPKLPREDFVPQDQRALAFMDTHVRLAHGQVMMQPKQEARLLQEVAPRATDSVLEIGTGSGYMTGLLASMAAHVDSVDLFPDFVASAQDKLAGHGFSNVEFYEGDASSGWEGAGVYDAIVLTGSIAELPSAYLEMLSKGGRLVAILGEDPIMEACLFTRNAEGAISRTSLFDTSLPPLVNATPPPRFVF